MDRRPGLLQAFAVSVAALVGTVGLSATPATAAAPRTLSGAAKLRSVNRSHAAGYARLSWSRRRHLLAARVRVTHLPPGSRSTVRLEAGSCASGRHEVVYGLRVVRVNEYGGGRATTRLPNADGIDTDGGWHVAVYGTTGAPTPADLLACGNIKAAS